MALAPSSCHGVQSLVHEAVVGLAWLVGQPLRPCVQSGVQLLVPELLGCILGGQLQRSSEMGFPLNLQPCLDDFCDTYSTQNSSGKISLSNKVQNQSACFPSAAMTQQSSAVSTVRMNCNGVASQYFTSANGNLVITASGESRYAFCIPIFATAVKAKALKRRFILTNNQQVSDGHWGS